MIKTDRKLAILCIIISACVFVPFTLLVLFSGGQVPPITVAEFRSGMEGNFGNGTLITEPFQITHDEWSIDLMTAESLPFWNFRMELYTISDDEVLVMKGVTDFWTGRIVLEHVSGADGTFVVPYEYTPDLPPDSYYLKIYWTRMSWFLQVFEFTE